MALVLSGSIDISGSMTATTIIVSAPEASGVVSSSQQIQNYFTFAKTGSANTFYGNQTITGSVRITNGLIIGASGSFASLGSYPNALTVNGNTTGTFGGAIFLARGSATQWGIISNDSDDLSITNNNSFSTRNIKIYDSAEKIEFTYSGSLADNSAGYHNIAFTGNAIVPYQTNHYDLGSETNYFRDLYISTGSIKFIDNGNVIGILSTTADGLNFDSNITIGSSSFEIGRRGTTYKNTNLVMGFDVMNDDIVTGQHNIGMGSEAGASLNSGNYNIMLGYQAGRQISNAVSNVLIGQGAGNTLLAYNSIVPSFNTFVGGNAGQFMWTGQKNVALGNAALYGQTGGTNTFQNNTAIGYGTATTITGVSTNNIYIGAYAGPASSFTTETYKFYVSNGDQNQQPYMFGNMANVSRSLDINASLNISGSLISNGGITGSLMATNGVVSSSNQLVELNTATGSLIGITNGLMDVTASLNLKTGSYATTGSNTFNGNQSITGSLRVTGSLKVGDWQHGEGVGNTAKLDIRTASDRGLKINGASSSDVIITAYRGASDDMVRGMRLEGSAINIYIGDGNANTGSSVASFNTNGLGFESGKGIDFSATSNGSGTMTSEILNDYEEGTFTPTYTGTDLTVVSYGNQFGWYTKVGRLVTVTICLMTEDITVVGSQNLKIGGLPFTSNSTAQATNALVIGDSSRWSTNPPKYGVIQPNVTEIVLYRDSGATGAGTDPVNVKTDDLADATGNRNVMRATLTYFV
jgi:hypothetical protein